ncbi:sulfotransferase [Patescibacteria group bacterium]
MKTFYKNYLKKQGILGLPKKDIFLVVGVSRSGTSLLMSLLDNMGVFIGNSDDFVPSDTSNPRGYFEHAKVLGINYSILKQARAKKEDIWGKYDISARGPIKKFQRAIVRLKINKFLKKMHSQPEDSWAMKSHLATFPLWQEYIPEFKLIIAFKDPTTVAHSNVKLKNFSAPFSEYLSRWEKINRELIYFSYRFQSLVINYNDLLDLGSKDRVLNKLIEFVGKGNIETLRDVVDPSLNRSRSEVEKLEEIYPLLPSQKEVFRVLEKIKT